MRIKHNTVFVPGYKMQPYGKKGACHTNDWRTKPDKAGDKTIFSHIKNELGNSKSLYIGHRDCEKKARLRRAIKKSARTEWKKDVQPSIDDVLFLEWEQDCKSAEWYDYDDY